MRPDLDGRVQLCLRMDDGGWVNHLAATDSHRWTRMEIEKLGRPESFAGASLAAFSRSTVQHSSRRFYSAFQFAQNGVIIGLKSRTQ
jgi:hypothetical protein